MMTDARFLETVAGPAFSREELREEARLMLSALRQGAESARPELLPCPFCGGEAYYDNDGARTAWIQCGGCGAKSPATRIAAGDAPLFAAWNRRAALGEKK